MRAPRRPQPARCLLVKPASLLRLVERVLTQPLVLGSRAVAIHHMVFPRCNNGSMRAQASHERAWQKSLSLLAARTCWTTLRTTPARQELRWRLRRADPPASPVALSDEPHRGRRQIRWAGGTLRRARTHAGDHLRAGSTLTIANKLAERAGGRLSLSRRPRGGFEAKITLNKPAGEV